MYLKKGTSALRLSDWWSHTDARDLFKWKEKWILFLLMLMGQYIFMNHKRTKCPPLYKYLAKVSKDGTLRVPWGQGEHRSWRRKTSKRQFELHHPTAYCPRLGICRGFQNHTNLLKKYLCWRSMPKIPARRRWGRTISFCLVGLTFAFCGLRRGCRMVLSWGNIYPSVPWVLFEFQWEYVREENLEILSSGTLCSTHVGDDSLLFDAPISQIFLF